jgi:hypothetical protein
MKKQTSKYILAACLGVSLLAACNKQLEEYNPGLATADAAWSTPQGFLTNVNAAYSEQRAWYGKEDGLFLGESGTDLWFNAARANYANQLTRYEGFQPATGNPNRALWVSVWRAINICNAGINRIDDAGFADATERNRRLAELRFLRGFYYWHVVEQWGGVMLRTTETQSFEATAVRRPVADFYDLIIGDLQFAAANLPASSGEWGAEYSRATKKSALGFLARAYLSRAYYATGSEAQQWFTRARDAANEVIARRGEFKVALNPSYAALFAPANNKQQGRDNGEALYVISNSANNISLNYDINANRLHLWFLERYSNKINGLQQTLQYGYDQQQRLMPTWHLLNLYNENIDSRYEASFQEVWLATNNYNWTATDVSRYGKSSSVLNRARAAGTDTILYVTKRAIARKDTLPYIVIDRDSTYNSTNKTIRGNDFVALKKFADPNRQAANSQPGYNDIMVMRLAEMYMISAEAEFRLGNAAAAATQINVLRTRAAKSGQTTAMQVTAADITEQFILDERAREFAGEMLRWFDVKRIKNNNNFAAYIKATNPDITAVQDYHRLRPVPQTEMDALLNAAAFGQNPGY